ncbi:proprotein convertase subtilisin/kexin type 6 isoform X3 [Channa argus]|uniref:proprotein convertase subtilisin/kexin type 6 isoform X3 n=1 Tax=Channa argus TaxID=215402 RepID=UPI0035217A15
MTDHQLRCSRTQTCLIFSNFRKARMTLFVLFSLLSVRISQSVVSGRGDVYTNHWAVRITGGPEQADRIAAKYGYVNMGQIGSLEDHYHFHHSRVVRRAVYSLKGPHSFIHMDPMVDWAQQQVVKERVKRHVQSDLNIMNFNDPNWSNMWYIHCNDKNSPCHSEMNIISAWQRGYTGKNVVVTILDDGIERNHPDLAQNYDHLASYDVNGNDHDPTPRYDARNENIHGTRCAGEVAAVANNSHCIIGVAYNAHIGGIRMLDGDVTDIVEAKSLGIRPDYIDIYSASWGPKDDGKTVDGPGPLTKQAFEEGIKKGRKGLGSIFVWASGNGGRQGDHCSCDGYTSSIYTISISSTTENGNMPWYLEVCSSIIATTYSSGELYERRIVTTDLQQRCTDGHTGTSVSAPIVSGIIALALEANLLLTWRDVQHLLVKTSRPVHLKANDWKTNAAGHRVSHLYGFGLVDAEAMVLEAIKWRTVPSQHMCSQMAKRHSRHIQAGQRLNSSITTSGCLEEPEQHVDYLEHVVVKVLIVHPRRGDLEINLISPSGTRSQLLAKRNCVSHCPLGHYEDIGSHRCRRCFKGCEKCVAQSARECLSCRRGLYLNTLNSSCVNTCPPGYFGDESQKRCLKCHHTCTRCLTFANRCSACREGYSLAGMTCVPQCINGTFFHLEEMTCSQCHPSCRTCTGPSKEECIQCAEGYLQQEWQCVQACAPGYYSAEAAGVPHKMCHRCEGNCLSCSDPGTTCTKCKEGYSLVSRTCIVNASCKNANEMFCDMVKTNRLCEKKLYHQFCCRTCLMNG